ncbi:hypothetical protein POL68_23655 [Stigmatella sp. ncwal1]|uniref:Uncharacterized protein n=2 Tax=Stigmatella TaxID=40 RepID=E3FUM8_STIAD|nr:MULTISPECIES: hypothetical protein [Stigmatella]ADO75911.1 uncharacterized protein STAUR_8156 [Stigmatella aurantiaca DW4/3-1]MDC0711487.1 hypothetical protein [Stigmatella ashevillena]
MREADLRERDGIFLRATALWKWALWLEPKRTELHERLASTYERMDLQIEAREHLRHAAEHYTILGDVDRLVRTLERLQVLSAGK